MVHRLRMLFLFGRGVRGLKSSKRLLLSSFGEYGSPGMRGFSMVYWALLEILPPRQRVFWLFTQIQIPLSEGTL